MAEAINEGLLDKLKTAIKTSTAGAKARAAGDWFREKVKQAVTHLMYLKIIFLGYIRELNQIDQCFNQNLFLISIKLMIN